MISVACRTHVCDSQESAENPLWTSGTSGEPAPWHQPPAAAKHHRGTLVHSLPTRLFAAEAGNNGFIHLLDLISTPLRWQILSEERCLGDAAPDLSLGMLRRLETGVTMPTTTAATLSSAAQFSKNYMLRSCKGLGSGETGGEEEVMLLPQAFPAWYGSQDIQEQPCQTDLKCTPVTLQCNCLRSYPCQKDVPGFILNAQSHSDLDHLGSCGKPCILSVPLLPYRKMSSSKILK